MGRVSIEQYEEGKHRAVWVISCRAVGGASTQSSMGSLSASPHDSLCLQQEWNMGQRASDTRGITFEDVEVPAEVSPVPDCLVCVLLSAGACSRPVFVCLVCVLGSGACSRPVFVCLVCVLLGAGACSGPCDERPPMQKACSQFWRSRVHPTSVTPA